MDHDTDDRDEQGAGADPRVGGRAELLPEEKVTGSDDPMGQAEAVLEASDERTEDRDAASGTHQEHRRSEDTVDPT